MRATRFLRWILASVLAFALARDASAQLLSSVLQPVLDTVNTVTCALPVLSASPKLDAAVQKWAGDGGAGRLRVIVSAQAGLLGTVRNLLLSLGVTPLGDLTGINALIAEIDANALSNLACATSVSSISIDAVVTVSGEPSSTDSPYSLRATLGLPNDTPSGAGVGVAVVDSGIAGSADFGSRITGFVDFTNGARSVPPSDGYGHGTHVAGLIAGNGSLSASSVYQGVGPQVRLIGMKVLDATGAGRTSDVIRAVEYATARRSTLGIQVINLSLGHPVYEPAARDPLVRAVEAASRAGIVVVAAAGNYGINRDTGESGYGGIASPGNAPSAITVGAVMTKDTVSRNDDAIAPYSSRGPTWYDGIAKPDIVAPGHSLASDAAIDSTLYTRYPDLRVGSNYLRLSGTSMAAAVTSGAVALILEANRVAHPGAPALTPNAVKAILEYSSLPVRDASGGQYDELSEGAGALNAGGAVALAQAIDPSQPVGYYWWTSAVTPSSTIGAEGLSWGQHLVWGTHVVWGSSIDTNERAWSVTTPWGSDTVWGSHVVWGSDVVWEANNTVWPSHIVWGSSLVGTSYDDDDHIVWGTADMPDSTVWGNLADTPDGSAVP